MMHDDAAVRVRARVTEFLTAGSATDIKDRAAYRAAANTVPVEA